ncbi:MAG TPA: hypothetical protein VFA50_13270 [Stellaceae bacterium]|nr:hypothetical protein [Stellaceae bacterium]
MEEKVLSDPLVQVELRRQQDDMTTLQAAAAGKRNMHSAINDVRERARKDAPHLLKIA